MLKPIFSLSLCTLLVVLCSATSQIFAQAPTRFAVILGANEGGRGRPNLRYANRDAEEFAILMKSLGNLDPSRVFLLTEARRSKFISTMATLKSELARSGKPSELIVYYSGHSDETSLLLGLERLDYQELKQLVEGSGARMNVIILDSCSSGAMIATKGGSRKPGFVKELLHGAEGTAIITSSSRDEYAQESERLKSSFFTHYLLSGLRGAADQNQDKLITLTEAYQHAYTETTKVTAGTQMGAQHPNYSFQIKGRGDLVLMDLRSRTAGLLLERADAGEFFISSPVFGMVAELRKTEGRSAILALEPGSYELIQRKDSQYWHGAFTVKKDQRIPVSSIAFKEIPSEKIAVRGGEVHPERLSRMIFQMTLWPSDPQGATQVTRYANVHLSPWIGEMDEVVGGGIGLVGHISREVIGVSAALGFSYNRDAIYGGQFSLGLSASDQVVGLQIGSITSSRFISGGQLGFINHSSGRITGAQVGLVNIAKNLTGVQLGLISISDHIKGIPLSPIFVTKDGFLKGDLWIDSMGFPMLSIRSASDYYFTTIHAGGIYPTLGFGLGLRLPIFKDSIALDHSWFMYRRRQGIPEKFEMRLGYFQTRRFYYEWQMGPSWTLLVGISQSNQKYDSIHFKRLPPLDGLTASEENSTHARVLTGALIGASYAFFGGTRP